MFIVNWRFDFKSLTIKPIFLKVKLHNIFNRCGCAYSDLDKGLIIIYFKGIEILIECSVHSSLSHIDENLEVINEDILKTIFQYCAWSDGCQGVWLVQSIIRPQCVQKLTLMKYKYGCITFQNIFIKKISKFWKLDICHPFITSFWTFFNLVILWTFFMVVILMVNIRELKDQVVVLEALKQEFLMGNCNLNYRHTWPNVLNMVR
jgi:hypothetical protein